jgi:hypothetical protein
MTHPTIDHLTQKMLEHLFDHIYSKGEDNREN